MSEVANFDDAWARRITERIRYTALGIRDGVDKLQMLVTEAQNGDAHVKLGYPSWTAYLADVFAEAPLRLERDHRREVVAWLAGEGMSNRAIAAVAGTDERTVRRDLGAANAAPADAPLSVAESAPASPEAAGSDGGTVTGEVEPPNAPSPVTDEPFTVDPATGEVTFDTSQFTPDGPVVTEHTVTEKTRVVTGLDGKTYEQKPPTPRRGSIIDDARNAGWQLRKAVERVQRIVDDDRYTRNKAEILAALQPHLDLAAEVLSDL